MIGFNRTKVSSVLVLAILATTLCLASLVYFSFKRSAMESSIAFKESSVNELSKQVAGLDGQGVAGAYSASRVLADIDSQYLAWSGIIQRVQNLVPKTSLGQPVVDFLSYSGGKDGLINLTVRTLSGATDPFQDTADLLKAFNKSDDFQEAFIPSITKNITQDGSTVLNYTMRMQFLNGEATNSNQ